jgi:hypothetical protein
VVLLAGGTGVTGAKRKKMFADAKKKKSKHGGDCQKKNELLKCQQSADPDCFLALYRRYGTDGWRKYANSETITLSTAMQHGWIGVGRLHATYVAN